MVLLLRICGAIGGVCLLFIAIGGYFLRQAPSTAFWVLGAFDEEDQHNLYLSTPDSGVRREVARNVNQNRLYPVGWLPDGDAFLYLHQTDYEIMHLRRFDLPSFTSEPIADHLSSTPYSASFLSPIPHSDWFIIVLNSEAGASIHRVSPDGTTLEPISPVFESISTVYWTSDGEWMYYVAGEGGNLTNGLFRQRQDGSDLQDLMQFRGTVYLTPTADGSDTFLFTVYSNTITFRQQVFRISPAEDEPLPLTPANENFSLVIHEPSEWVILRHWNSDRSKSQLYRVGLNGGDLAPLYPRTDAFADVDIVFPTSQQDVFIIARQDDSAMLFRINLATLERTALTPPNHFTTIANARVITGGRAVVFEGTIDTDLAYYRVESDGTSLRKLTDLSFSPSRNSLTLFTGNSAINREAADNANHTLITQIDLSTGVKTTLVEFESPIVDIGLSFAPPHVGGLIATMYSTFQQTWIDPETKRVEPVLYGSDLRFSPNIDTAWNMTTLLVVGLGLLFGAYVWSAYSIRDTASNSRRNALGDNR